MDPKVDGELSVSTGEGPEMSTDATSALVDTVDEKKSSRKVDNVVSVSTSASALISPSLGPTLNQGNETERKVEESSANISSTEVDQGTKSSSRLKNPPVKRKVKVEWTPELHKKFVQAVEQLGVDKAVPSKILELMKIDCLTRHNVASHLQKYRSHRKHVLAREAEAVSWSRRRHAYSTAGGARKKDPDSWVVPTTGYPPVTPNVRHLHVWGHPSTNQSLLYMWPRPPPTWASIHPQPPLLTGDTSFWYYHHRDVPVAGVPCSLPHYTATGFPTSTVPGIPPFPVYKADRGVCIPNVSTVQTLPQPPNDFHISIESIDTAIGEVLSKPWLPLPLGLKPPSFDSVMVELQNQGISKIPPDKA